MNFYYDTNFKSKDYVFKKKNYLYSHLLKK
jgi:hypothetical protein